VRSSGIVRRIARSRACRPRLAWSASAEVGAAPDGRRFIDSSIASTSWPLVARASLYPRTRQDAIADWGELGQPGLMLLRVASEACVQNPSRRLVHRLLFRYGVAV
jgi:hypothetical protein